MDARQRLLSLLRGVGLLLCVGLAYALWVGITGLAVPCPFHALTGLLCPGCGVTRMCLALLRLDFLGAWQANPVLLLLSPVILGLLVWRGAVYVKWNRRVGHGENLAWIALVVILVAWGVARNVI